MNEKTTPALKVLVVDDEPLFQRLVQHHLERAGFVALNAANGRLAIEVAERESPCVIVMDVMMEDMDGLSALRQLKKSDKTRPIPVIMVTASEYQITRREAEASGAACFMTKPFSPAQLLMSIRRLLPDVEEPTADTSTGRSATPKTEIPPVILAVPGS
jgi:CheY-like chemotaxis protein